MTMERYAGTCEPLCAVDISNLVPWVMTIPLSEWPHQDRLSVEHPYPAMVTESAWHGFGEKFDPLVLGLMAQFPPSCTATGRYLSVVVPGQRIVDHDDVLGESWRVRIHVPMVTNPMARMWWRKDEANAVHMQVGTAYKINVEIDHGLANMGAEPRIHFWFDVRTTT